MPNNLREAKKDKKSVKNKIKYPLKIAWIGKDTHTHTHNYWWHLLLCPRWDNKSSNEWAGWVGWQRRANGIDDLSPSKQIKVVGKT